MEHQPLSTSLQREWSILERSVDILEKNIRTCKQADFDSAYKPWVQEPQTRLALVINKLTELVHIIKNVSHHGLAFSQVQTFRNTSSQFMKKEKMVEKIKKLTSEAVKYSRSSELNHGLSEATWPMKTPMSDISSRLREISTECLMLVILGEDSKADSDPKEPNDKESLVYRPKVVDASSQTAFQTIAEEIITPQICRRESFEYSAKSLGDYSTVADEIKGLNWEMQRKRKPNRQRKRKRNTRQQNGPSEDRGKLYQRRVDDEDKPLASEHMGIPITEKSTERTLIRLNQEMESKSDLDIGKHEDNPTCDEGNSYFKENMSPLGDTQDDKQFISNAYQIPEDRIQHYISKNIPSLFVTKYDISRFVVASKTCDTVIMIGDMCTKFKLDHTLTKDENALINSKQVNVFSTRNVPMANKFCQFLRTSVTIDNVTKEMTSTNTPVILIAGVEQQNVFLDYFSTFKQTDGPRKCILLVGNTDDCPQSVYPRNILIGYATNKNIMQAVDDLLERYMFGLLKDLSARLWDSNTNAPLADDFRLLEVGDNIRRAFKRSEVPAAEWPNFPPKRTCSGYIEKAINAVVKTNGVLGCSKMRGVLVVYMICSDSKADDKNNEDIVKEILDRYEIISYQIIRGTFRNLHKPGDPVLWKAGTLGGFAEKHSRSEYYGNNVSNGQLGTQDDNITSRDNNLVALVSRHVVIHVRNQREDNTCYLTVGQKNLPIGVIPDIHNYEDLDILPIDIYPKYRRHCKTTFRTETDQAIHAQLLQRSAWKNAKGMRVHFWGQVSQPGLGYIHEPLMTSNRNGGVCYVLIRSRNNTPFSQQGDSGSIVCAANRNCDSLYAIAMLKGEYTPKDKDITREGPLYIALHLCDGLEQLSEHYRADFKLCAGNYEEESKGIFNFVRGIFRSVIQYIGQS